MAESAELASLSLTHVYYNPNDPLSFLGAWLALLPQALCIIYVTVFWSTREAEVALAFAGQMACEAVNFALKRLIKEERPRHHHVSPQQHTFLGMSMDGDEQSGSDGASLAQPFRRGYGMPSSHAQFAAFWAVTIALFLLVRYRPAKPAQSSAARTQTRTQRTQRTAQGGWSVLERVATSLACFVVAVLIAWSRVYLHYHTPKQVLVGFAAGAVVAVGWFVATGVARHVGLLGWALDLPLAQYLRLRDLMVEEDLVQAGWEKWQERRAARAAQAAAAEMAKNI